MERWPVIVLVILSLVSLVFIVATSPTLPPTVATHFAAGGRANGWMTREGYTLFALVFAIALPWLLYAGSALLPARWPGVVNLPHRDYWLAPPRRAQALAVLQRYGAIVAGAMMVLSAAMHGAILDANRRTPAQLHEPAFIAVVAVFAVTVIVASIGMYRRFKRVPG
jgi:uncharacterized membrane protein